MDTTAAGQKLLERAQVILRYVADTCTEVSAISSKIVGEVTIGMPPTFAEVYGPPLIAELMERFPDVLIRVDAALSGHLIEKLQRGEVDIAFLYNPPSGESLRLEPILNENLCLVGVRYPGVRPQGNIAFDALNGLPLALPRRVHSLRQTLDSRAEASGFTLLVKLEIDSVRLQIGLAARGLCYSIVPRSTVIPEIETGKLGAWEIVEPAINRRLQLATPAGRPLTAAASAIWHEIPDTLSPLLA
ncbi:LysR substrate binding domain protein [Necator americanus]|uniref:LysR substrate binding domain protein n=2 Tax=cellular organisms TaxID=131567 RepID=W2TEC2_NECAM|nr:LysR substrate binding domain protein [Necator americanus]ETN79342.1 LysR substrate binding domain protein [Necator americanus]